MSTDPIDKKKIQRNRMLSYFASAAIHIIDEEGLSALTIRKVADQAGYNSATLYHYFSNLSHLTLFASVHYLKAYAIALSEELPKSKSPLDSYLKVWECFCRCSYQQPDVYEMLFFRAYRELSLNEIFETYYEVFPEELEDALIDYSPMLVEANIFKREFIALKKVLDAIHHPISEENVTSICEMNILIYRGMLSTIGQDSPLSLSLEEAVAHTVHYMKTSLAAHGLTLGN